MDRSAEVVRQEHIQEAMRVRHTPPAVDDALLQSIPTTPILSGLKPTKHLPTTPFSSFCLIGSGVLV